MGLLDQVLGNVLGGRAGGGTMGGGLGGGLGGQSGGGGMSPVMMAILALLAQKAMSGRGTTGGGGLGDLLGGGSGGLGGGLGGLLGGGSGGLNGGILAGGLGSLIDSFTRSGHGDIASSWVGPGDNRPIGPNQLADALGPETVDQLSQQTGMQQQDLLSELSHVLPGVVDQLTPQGRLPREDEFDRY